MFWFRNLISLRQPNTLNFDTIQFKLCSICYAELKNVSYISRIYQWAISKILKFKKKILGTNYMLGTLPPAGDAKMWAHFPSVPLPALPSHSVPWETDPHGPRLPCLLASSGCGSHLWGGAHLSAAVSILFFWFWLQNDSSNWSALVLVKKKKAVREMVRERKGGYCMISFIFPNPIHTFVNSPFVKLTLDY